MDIKKENKSPLPINFHHMGSNTNLINLLLNLELH